MKRDWKNFFSERDFDPYLGFHVEGKVKYLTPRDAVEIANTFIRQALEEAPVVHQYTNRISNIFAFALGEGPVKQVGWIENPPADMIQGGYYTHQARLVCVEEVKK